VYIGDHLLQNASPRNICVIKSREIEREEYVREKEMYAGSGRTTWWKSTVFERKSIFERKYRRGYY